MTTITYSYIPIRYPFSGILFTVLASRVWNILKGVTWRPLVLVEIGKLDIKVGVSPAFDTPFLLRTSFRGHSLLQSFPYLSILQT